MANCENCSAPLSASSITCDYCGSRNDVDLRGIHRYTVHEPDSSRSCPRCDITLRTINIKTEGKCYIEQCMECMGLFFDPGELEALIKASVSNVFHIDHHRIDNLNKTRRHTEYGMGYIKCPVCGTLMNRVNFGARSGVIVDRCRDHGIWLDGGELRHLLEWVKAGGELLSRKKEEQVNKLNGELAKHRERDKNRATQHVAYAGFNGYSSALRRSDPDIFDIIKRVVNWIVR